MDEFEVKQDPKAFEESYEITKYSDGSLVLQVRSPVNPTPTWDWDGKDWVFNESTGDDPMIVPLDDDTPNSEGTDRNRLI